MDFVTPDDNFPRDDYQQFHKAFHVRTVTFDLDQMAENEGNLIDNQNVVTESKTLKASAKDSLTTLYDKDQLSKWAK